MHRVTVAVSVLLAAGCLQPAAPVGTTTPETPGAQDEALTEEHFYNERVTVAGLISRYNRTTYELDSENSTVSVLLEAEARGPFPQPSVTLLLDGKNVSFGSRASVTLYEPGTVEYELHHAPTGIWRVTWTITMGLPRS